MPRIRKSSTRTTQSPASRSTKRSPRRFVARKSGIHGRGVFALTDIPKAARLMEFLGERISNDEADERYGDLHATTAHTMLLAATDEVVIDTTHMGGSARWVNHSCVPNCEAIEEDGRVYIESRRAIRAGEELLFDYDLIVEGRKTEKVKRDHACYCGAKRCRGTMIGAGS
jgi:uncharacterized protein